MINNEKESPENYCEICKNYHDFIFPKDLFDAIKNNEVVIFAGAGISTEGSNIFPSTLYEDILAEKENSGDKDLPLSQIMSEYCKKQGSKRGLIERICQRINYVQSHPGLYNTTVKFHQLLATIPCINEIITTNWDDFFERECHATPFVYEKDMAFWEQAYRKVLKLHGSINNLGSIVVTSEDYDERYESLHTGLLGSQLKLLITNKTLVFIGYSFNDEDFNRLFSFVRSQLGSFIKKFYIVTLDDHNNDKWVELGLEPIYTAGEYFLMVILHKLQESGCLISEDVINEVEKEHKSLREDHLQLANEINISDYPEVTFCLSYQDGMIHAFAHFLHHINYGQSLCKVKIRDMLISYDKLIKDKKRHKRWYDVAYLEGYIFGYLFVIMDNDDRKYFPHYFDLSMGESLLTLKEYKHSLSISERKLKSISKYASKFINNFPEGDYVPQHTYFL